MNFIFNYQTYEISFYSYVLVYRSILQEKKYNEEFIVLFLTLLKFLIEKHYYERDYVIESNCSFFDSIVWYLREKM